MEKWQWIAGRQNKCTYFKYCFLNELFKSIGVGIDGYILKYPPFAELPIHIDEVNGYHHFRLNITFKRKQDAVYIRKPIFTLFKNRIVLFRPDISEHGMVNGNGERKVLSLGLAIKK